MPQSNEKINPSISEGARALLFNCGRLGSDDRVYIISNPSTASLGEILKSEALNTCSNVEHDIIEEFKMHGQEPAAEVAAKMFAATIVFCITKMSMAHTKARLNANANRVKYFSLPDYSDNVMSSKALLADFRSFKPLSEKIAQLLTEATEVSVTTRLGTDLKMNVKGRTANAAPGFCYGDVLLASPPDAETNIAPNEFLTSGIAVIDGSIPCREIGLLESPIRLEIANGFVNKISGEKSDILGALFDRVNDPNCRVVAEFGIGLNGLAELTGTMLEDEGTFGTVHLGIGSNKTIGGENDVPFHLDHVIREATVMVDKKVLMREGVMDSDFLASVSNN
jgi:2,5-dihydroxypyridine 5,6-dioxygenase